jgi:DNA-binding MarR family transcriptional regulator
LTETLQLTKANASSPDIGLLLSDGFKRWTKVAERSLSRTGLSLAEVRALMMLSELGPSSMITLSAEQGMTAPGMTLVVDKLERAGLAHRVRSDADRRKINVVITGKGGETVRRARKLQDKFIQRTLGGVTSQELNSFLTTLNKIVAAAETTVNASSG